MHFCDQRCLIETPVVFCFHVMGLITVVYILVYGLIAANYGAWSKWGTIGYVLFLLCTGLYLVAVVWVSFFFHKHGRRHYQQRRLIWKTFLLVLVYIVGMGSAYCLLRHPTKQEMRENVLASLPSEGRITDLPNIIHMLQKEKKCCGIKNYLDYQHPRKDPDIIDLPDTCCKIIKPDCGVNTTLSSASNIAYTQGCIKTSISEIKHTGAYFIFKLISIFAMVPITFPVFTIVIMQVILCLTRPKNELPQRPNDYLRKQSWESGPSLVNVVFHAEAIIPTTDTDEAKNEEVQDDESSSTLDINNQRQRQNTTGK